jgi:hypothetical protein
MRAIHKIEAFGVDALSEKTGHHASTLYRWISKMRRGVGIKDARKRELIEATAGSEHALAWADFDPAQLVTA